MKAPTLKDFDHPMVFLFFFSLAFIPMMIGIFAGANRISGPAGAATSSGQ